MRLLITRPAVDAAILAERLTALGHEALIEPMLTITALPFTLPNTPIAAIILTSQHAVRTLRGHIRSLGLKDVPALCVGEVTATAARKAGLCKVVEGGGDAKSLVTSMIAALNPRTDTGIVLHVRGRHARGDIAGELRRHGFDAREIIVYEAMAATNLSQEIRHAIAGHALDGVLFLSPRTANIFCELTANAGLGPQLDNITAYCLSDAVAAELASLQMQIIVARKPRLSALLELLWPPNSAQS